MEINLVPYNPGWPEKFEKENKLIDSSIGPFITGGIHHVGSTAIPGMSAKPIIDIMVGVESLEKSKPCIKLLEKLGYNYFPYKTDQMLWFVKPSPQKRTHQLHLIPTDSKLFKERIAFRDYLIAHNNEAKDYEKLKKEFAKKYKNDREAYTEAKTEFVNNINKKASNPLDMN